jgi:peptidoglycan hydrolase-like protein with peptidoglycan-binding domain
MGLQSRFFRGIPELEAAAVSDPAHILIGAMGDHVAMIQQALMAIDGAVISDGELKTKRYGPSTANAVLTYKRKRNIVNRAYQTQPDNIVGKMTMAALDKGMLHVEATVSVKAIECDFDGRPKR